MSVSSLMTNYKMKKVFVDSRAAELAPCFGKIIGGGKRLSLAVDTMQNVICF